jgi:hypothetical protein
MPTPQPAPAPAAAKHPSGDRWFKLLESAGAPVIGYGNTLRGDDGIGPAVAEAVAALGLPGVRVIGAY